MPGSYSLLRQKLAKAGAQAAHLPRTLALIWAAAPGYTAAWAVLLVLQGLLPAVAVFLTRIAVDRLAAALGTPAPLTYTIAPAALLAAILALQAVLKVVADYVRAAQSEIVQDHITELVQERSLALDLAFYDSSDFYDHLHRARQEATYRPVALLDSLGILFQNALTLIGMSAILLPYGWWLPLLLFLSTLPAFFVVLRAAVRLHEWRQRSTLDERRTWYYDWLTADPGSAAELRLFHLGPYFRRSWSVLRSRLRGEARSLARSHAVAETAAGITALAATAAALGWMVIRLTQGQATLGDIALFYQAFQQGLGLMRSLLEGAARLYQNVLFLGNLFEFLSFESSTAAPREPVPFPGSPALAVEFKDVSFAYPSSDVAVLRDFNLKIGAGEITVIIGPNGSGKSTLLKLLCRLYDPASGVVAVNGTDLRLIDPIELRRHLTVLFQAPIRFNATAGWNIEASNLDSRSSSPQAAAEAAGADQFLKKLPAGYDQLLGRWFSDGAELSSGQWQRLALARALHRPAPLILLDEPTSAMDPWAEAEWLARFREIAAGRTAVLITHRFTTARLADTIHVLHEGGIVESGTHESLSSSSGLYAAWWRSQGETGRPVR